MPDYSFNFGDGQVQLFDTYEDAKKHLKGLIDPEEYEVREHEMIYIETGSIGENPKFKGMNSGEVCNVYTDGSSRGNGIEGAVAGVGVFYGKNDLRNVSRLLGPGPQTNNRAELAAMTDALLQAKIDRPSQLNIYSDSQYAIELMTILKSKWEERKYKRGDGRLMPNADLIEKGHQLLYILEMMEVCVEFIHIKGHSDNYGNDQADRLANEGAITNGGFKSVIDDNNVKAKIS